MSVFLLLVMIPGAFALSEQGRFVVTTTQEKNIAVFEKSMYANTTIAVSVTCADTEQIEVMITWLLRWSPCAQEYATIDPSNDMARQYLMYPNVTGQNWPYRTIEYERKTQLAICGDRQLIDLNPYDLSGPVVITKPMPTSAPKKDEKKSAGDKASESGKEVTSKDKDTADGTEADKGKTASRRKRAADEGTEGAQAPTQVPIANVEPEKAAAGSKETVANSRLRELTRTWLDGVYLFAIIIEPVDDEKPFKAEVRAEMKSPHGGYLSAIEWPLLPFYGVMCFVYVVYGLIWLVLSACNWRDLLRIQFWIGGVIFLGMLEKAVFFAEFESIKKTGMSVYGAVLFGEMVSCMKRTLARMLVIIVSLGFGIVKPRLGPVLHKVLGLGALYFILSAVEGCLRHLKGRTSMSNQETLALIPLAVLDAAICWWIFTGLVSTIRTLRLRRNLVKLSLYRHFTNTLIFAVVASIAFMIWSITQHKFSKCLSDWKELWVDEAFWHLLFSVVLMVIMILWRPSGNNQRYAFSALMDAADDEAGEPMIHDAFDGMKMRGVKGQTNGSPGMKDKSKADEDLKWIDDNIPSSVADTALPSLLDSDEEMMNTKFEMSKME